MISSKKIETREVLQKITNAISDGVYMTITDWETSEGVSLNFHSLESDVNLCHVELSIEQANILIKLIKKHIC